jgi:iron complex transport system substrate-binding protein
MLNPDSRACAAARRPAVVLLIMAFLLAATAPSAEPLPRVMSTNLCADLLLLAVAAPEQIVSLSRTSRDPALSPVAEQAAAYPTNRGGVEDLLYREPDIALVYLGWTGGRFGTLLSGRDVEVVPVPYPTDWEDALVTARSVAATIGRAEQGLELAAAAQQRMRELAEGLPELRALYLRPGGGSAGSGTYVDDVMTRLGLRNLAAEAGHVGWGIFPLELLVTDPPDLLLLGYFEQEQSLNAASYARHPLLRELLARTPSITVPSRLWGCGGLELIGAAEAIATQVRALDTGVGTGP